MDKFSSRNQARSSRAYQEGYQKGIRKAKAGHRSHSLRENENKKIKFELAKEVINVALLDNFISNAKEAGEFTDQLIDILEEIMDEGIGDYSSFLQLFKTSRDLTEELISFWVRDGEIDEGLIRAYM